MKKIFLTATAIAFAFSCSVANNSSAQPADNSASGYYIEEDYIVTPTPDASSSADFQPLPDNKGVEVAPQPMSAPNASAPQNQPATEIEETVTTVTQ